MGNEFREEWLRDIPNMDIFLIPKEYNILEYMSWKKEFKISEDNLISSGEDHFGKVYDVGEGLAAKVSRHSPFIKN